MYFDESKKIVVKYEKTGDFDNDYDIDDFLNEAGFVKQEEDNDVVKYLLQTTDPIIILKTIKWVVDKFAKVFGSPDALDVSKQLQNVSENFDDKKKIYQEALQAALDVKSKTEHNPEISPNFKRKLLPYQKKSVAHLLAIGNGANFSVPGSGKTTIAYAAISKWLDDGIVKKIFVIGPTSSFVPWEEEFEGCFGRQPRSIRLRGDIVKELPNLGHSYELFLMHYATAMNRIMEIQEFLSNYDTVLIIDESHWIKNPDLRRYASTALNISPFAKRRIVLTGTPMPNDARDLWTQLTFLWPEFYPLGNLNQYKDYVKKRGIGKYKDAITPLFERITKTALGLPHPTFPKYEVDLGPIQREIYDIIAAKTLQEINEANIRDQAKMQKFRMAKMIRLLQTASNPSMLVERSHEFDVNSERFGEQLKEQFGLAEHKIKISGIKDSKIYDKVLNYSTMEIPSKLVKAWEIAQDLMKRGEKVIIWSAFKLNMYVFQNQLFKDQKPILINGDISKDPDDDVNRDKLIREFKNDPNPRVLIATAASLGESVSLHQTIIGDKVCSHAIYLDRNYNGAQFMQSMDRIHRIGMLEDTKVQYHIIIAKNTIDVKIDQRLWEKNEDMHSALNSADLEPLEYDGKVIDIMGSEFDKDYNSLVEHLRELKIKYGN
jgi:SNF2 family DNA or RNA helicase